MILLREIKKTKLGQYLKDTYLNRMRIKDKMRKSRIMRAIKLSGNPTLSTNSIVINKVDVVVTTKCNLLCNGCSHLMPYYNNPKDLETTKIIKSMRILSESIDWFDHFNLLGGEPFLNSDLKYIMEAIPSKKSRLVQVLTNATIIPTDSELYDVMRRKKVHVVITPYPSNEYTRKQLISKLNEENIDWNYYYPEWTEYGRPIKYCKNPFKLMHQFIDCNEQCHNLFNGRLYYCFRCSHIYDLGYSQEQRIESVDLLNNTNKQNKRKIRQLIWRHKPFRACSYCLKGTDYNINIARGE